MRGFGLAICFCLWSKLYKYWNTHFRFQDWENFAPSFVCIGGVRKQNSSVSLNPTWKAENISKTLTLCQFSIIFSPYSHFLLPVQALQKWSWDFLLIGGKGHENPCHKAQKNSEKSQKYTKKICKNANIPLKHKPPWDPGRPDEGKQGKATF